MTRIVDSDGVPREIKDVDQSGGKYSPKASVYQTDGTGKTLAHVAIVLGALSFGGVIVGAILIPEIIEARANEAAAPANAKASYAERDARVALDYVTSIQAEIAKSGIVIKNPSGH